MMRLLQRMMVACLLGHHTVFAENEASQTISSHGHDPYDQQYHYTHTRMLKDTEETIILFFHGTLFNDLAEPMEGAKIQFWHTDKRGIYNHPVDLRSRGNPELLQDFTYYGTAATDSAGSFNFTTYRPGIYTGRPITHIHYKVFSQDENNTRTERLTSQFYFADENINGFSPALQLDLVPLQQMTAGSGNRIRYFETRKTIIVDMNLGGNTTLTPSQQEGPFYPVVDFFDVGSDLTNATFSSVASWPAPASGGASPTAAPTANPVTQLLSSASQSRTFLQELTSLALMTITVLGLFARVIEA
jgi:protocatechuate 3,4-dioxygenase beta subunit